MNKLIHFFFFIILLTNCKGETKKVEEIKFDSTKAKNNIIVANEEEEDCYGYLTELVRSSNFPFSQWKISKNKINILIDEKNEEFIRAKVVFDTDGTGTIGWIEYYIKTGVLLNTSANLEEAQKLRYDTKWKLRFDSCFTKDNNKSNYIANENSLKSIYETFTELSLPNEYNFDSINDEKGFVTIDEKYYNLFPLEKMENYKIASLPEFNGIKSIILIAYNESGQSTWYLFTLDKYFKPISNIILYSSVETEKGTKTTTYSISKQYRVSIINSIISESREEITSKNNYVISNRGYIESLNTNSNK